MFFKDAALVCECCRKRVEVSALGVALWSRLFLWRHVRSLVRVVCISDTFNTLMVSPWLSLLAAFTWLLCVKIDIFLKIILNERAHCSCPGFMMSLAGFLKVIQTPQTEVRYMLHIFKGGLSSVKTYAEA